MMYFAYKLNNQGDNIQPWPTPFPILNQFIVSCKVLAVASWPTYRFFRRQVGWSDNPISWRIFQIVVMHTVKCFSVVNEAEWMFFLEFPCFLYDPMNVSNLTSSFSAFSKPILYTRKFSVHELLKPNFKDFEHNLTSLRNELDCQVDRTLFGIAFLWDLRENWPFPVLWPLLSFPNLLTYWLQHFNSIIF